MNKLYNVVYDSPDYTQAKKIIGLTPEELALFVDAYNLGQAKVSIRGTSKPLSKINRVGIFDCSKLKFAKNDDAIRYVKSKDKENYYIKEYYSEFKRFFIRFGVEVTTQFVGPSGKRDRSKPGFSPINDAPHDSDNANDSKTNPTCRIFVSHSTKDKDIVTSFCDLILHNALNIDLQKMVFNTSLDGTKPRSGEDFRQRIKSELKRANIVLQFISPNYKASEVCLNEMGAAWVLCEKVIPLIVERGNFDTGFINSTTQQVKLYERKSLLQFADELHEIVGGKVTSVRWDTKIEEFIKRNYPE